MLRALHLSKVRDKCLNKSLRVLNKVKKLSIKLSKDLINYLKC